MHFSEDDIREALKRKDPGEGFTQRTLMRVNQARVNQSQAESKPVSGVGHGRGGSLVAGVRHWRLSVL